MRTTLNPTLKQEKYSIEYGTNTYNYIFGFYSPKTGSFFPHQVCKIPISEIHIYIKF